MRIVSLIPSGTEIVCALGFENQLVGRSHECDYPERIRRLPICSEPRFDINGTSIEIDQRVQATVREALSVYRVNTEKLKELKPDVIVTQDHCDVCAVSLKDVEQAVCDWLGSKPKIIALKSNSLTDVWEGIHSAAQILGCSQKGDELVKQCQSRIQKLSEQARKLSSHPLVACIEWMDPLMVAGNWMPEFIESLGGKNLLARAGEHSPKVNWEDVRKKDPDVILIMPCGWDMNHSLQEVSVLTEKPGWDNLKAVREQKVYVADGNQYFNRPGPRLVDSLEILAEVMYPDFFSFHHEGKGWRKILQHSK